MDYGKVVRTIQVNTRAYVIQMIIGVSAFCSTFVLNYDNYTYFGLPTGMIMFGGGALIAVLGLTRLLNSRGSQDIIVYEKGIRYGFFDSDFDSLLVSKHKQTLQLISGSKVSVIKEAISAKDYQYLLSLNA